MSGETKLPTSEDDAMEAAKEAFLETVQVTLVSFNLDGALRRAISAYMTSTQHDAERRRGAFLAKAFLRYFNPSDLPEDSSQQWQQLDRWAEVTIAKAVTQ